MTMRIGILPRRVCYGVDVQGGSLVVVEARRTARGAECATIEARDPGFLRAMQSGSALTAAGLSVREGFARWIETPYDSPHKARKVLPSLLDLQLPFPLEECVYEFISLRRSDAGRVVALVAAARRAEVEHRLNVLRGLGVDPALLDQEGVALWTQSVREIPCPSGERAQLRALVYVADDRSALVVGVGDRYLDAHAVRLDNPGQIGRLIRVHGGGGVPMRWVLAGPGVRDAAAREEVAQRLTAECAASLTVHKDPGTFLPRALAVRALEGRPLACNLRVGALAHPRVVRLRARRALRAAILFAAAGILLCGANIAARGVIQQRRAQAEREFLGLAGKMAGHPIGGARGEHALKVVRAAVLRRQEALRPFADACRPSLTRELLAVMSLGRKANLRFEAIHLGTNELQITGLAPDWTGCDELVSRLGGQGRGVTLDRKEALADEWIPFVIARGAERE